MRTIILLSALATLMVACAGHVEKTSPCKRPKNLSSFVDSRIDCGEAQPVNSDSQAAIREILAESQVNE